MALRTRILPVEELKQIFVETLLNNTNKVSKVSDLSVLSGVSYGVAKIAQKAMKDIALVEASLSIDDAFGTQLDDVAQKTGIAPRFGASESSTYLRLVGDVGTTYLQITHTFQSLTGIVFQLEADTTIGSFGFTYAKVRSVDSGAKTNVPPLNVTVVNPVPTGHRYVINEFQAIGGRDLEDDDAFRQRIKDSINIVAKGTLAALTQAFLKINENVLRLFYRGINASGQTLLAVATQNGIDLTPSEFDTILDGSEQYLSISDLRPFGAQNFNIALENVIYQPIDVSFRVDLFPSANVDDTIVAIQTAIAQYLDFRFWEPRRKVEWDNLLELVKKSPGIKYVPDTHFTPGVDVIVDINKLPRLRGFLMLDLNGNIIQNFAGTLSPVFYPNEPDFSFQQTALATIS